MQALCLTSGVRWCIAIIDHIYYCSFGSFVSRPAGIGDDRALSSHNRAFSKLQPFPDFESKKYSLANEGDRTMNIIKYILSAFTAIAMALGMSLVSCSDKPTEPTVTRPSYKIAFVSSRNGAPGIFSMNNDGTDQKCLFSDSSAHFLFFSWSPDGYRLAFNCNRYPHEDAYEIYVMRADGAFPTRLTYSTFFMGEFEVPPVWSPDGYKLAFQSWRDGNSDIHVMNADGSNRINVTHDTTNNYDPIWRPDGLGVTFVSARDNASSRRYDLCFANADGTVREWAAIPSYEDSLSAPFWFPVGSTIGYLGISQNGSVDVFVCTMTPGLTSCTGNSFGASHTADHVAYPAWSPDGSTLAFVSNAEGRKNIYVLKTRDLSDSPKRLTNSLAGEGAFTPAWSPDGAEIVFAADWTGNAEIYVMNADGTNLRKLTTSSGSGGPTCAMSGY